MTTKVVGSDMPSFVSDALKEDKRGYGQNGYGGASSDLPGQRTTSGFLPQTDLAAAQAARKKIQERTVTAAPPPLSYGMAQRTPRSK
jgi:hypothetical protein